MKTTPLEGLLRSPYEWISSVVLLIAMVLLIRFPDWFLLPPLVNKTVVVCLGMFAFYRSYQGWRVICYQKNLQQLPLYTISSDAIPCYEKKLFLGKGFRWEAKHAQRFYELSLAQHQHFLQPARWYQWLRKQEMHWEKHPLLKHLAVLTQTKAFWNPISPYPEVGGQPALHGVEPNEKPIVSNLSERVGHTLVLGTTRVGKTRLAEVLINQDIRRGDTVIVIDPKGDQDLLESMKEAAKLCGREKEVRVFHLGFSETSLRYNPIGQFTRVTEVANRIANALPSSGNSAAFKEFAWRFVNVIAQALVVLGKRPCYHSIRRYLIEAEPLIIDYCNHILASVDPNWQEQVLRLKEELKEKPAAVEHVKSLHLRALLHYLNQHVKDDVIAQGLCSTYNYERSYFDKITASLLPLLDKLTTGPVAELISPDYDNLSDTRAFLEWWQVIRQKQIVYVGLDALTDTTVASCVGNALLADLVSVAGRLYKEGIDNAFLVPGEPSSHALPSICIHSDEFSDVIGEEFIPLLNKAGGAGMKVTAYTQTLSDVEARLSDKAKAGQVAGNFNTLILLRVKELATAKLLTDQLPMVNVSHLQAVSSVSDTIGEKGVLFRSSNEDRIVSQHVPLLCPSHVMQLPKGQAFVLLEGAHLYKVRLPLKKN